MRELRRRAMFALTTCADTTFVNCRDPSAIQCIEHALGITQTANLILDHPTDEHLKLREFTSRTEQYRALAFVNAASCTPNALRDSLAQATSARYIAIAVFFQSARKMSCWPTLMTLLSFPTILKQLRVFSIQSSRMQPEFFAWKCDCLINKQFERRNMLLNASTNTKPFASRQEMRQCLSAQYDTVEQLCDVLHQGDPTPVSWHTQVSLLWERVQRCFSPLFWNAVCQSFIENIEDS